MVVRIYPLAVLFAALVLSGSAEAAPSTRLVYGRGPGAEKCADESWLRQAVAARVG